MEVVFPKNNEPEFIKIAERLEIAKLVFVYDEKNYLTKELNFNTNVELEKGLFLSKPNQSIKSKYIVARSSEKDRAIMEEKKANIMFGFEEMYKKDFMHQRASGLNHTICDIARNNNISIGFSYSLLFGANSHLIAGRMMQNFRLCRKFKVKTLIASFTEDPSNLRSTHDVAALFRVLGF